MNEVQIESWKHQLSKHENFVQEKFGSLGMDQLNFKPNALTWSIAQNLEHLIKINESYYPVFHQLKSGNYTRPIASYVPGYARMMGNWIQKSVSPDRKNKIKTRPIWEPEHSMIAVPIIDQYVSHHRELTLWMDRIEEKHYRTPVPSPAGKIIVYPLHKVFDIICDHELRHLNQAEELLPLAKNFH